MPQKHKEMRTVKTVIAAFLWQGKTMTPSGEMRPH